MRRHIFLPILFVLSFLASFSVLAETTSGEQEYSDEDFVPRGGLAALCETIRPTVAQALGQRSNSARVNCYLLLFHKETSCRYNINQAQGNAGNPHAAYGLCSLERSPVVRRNNGRGPNCVDISTVANQTKCCHDIMRTTRGRYFGPVKRGEVPRCDQL